MGWPYAFLTLDEVQKLQRREYLDWYGTLAQLSVLFPLLAIQTYSLVSWLRTLLRNPNELDTPSSPRIKEARGSIGIWDDRARRARWWLGKKVVLGSDVVGTRGEVVGAVSWMVWLLNLSFADTGRDYLHLTKRFGSIASSQLPFHYLLALKSPYSPLQYLTGRSHESLNTLHQLLGRVITVLLYAHAALYLNFYIQSNLLVSKVQEWYVICGILGVWAFTAVGTTALAPVRKWSYRVFYVTHVTLASLLLPLLWFHVSHIRIYLYETAAVYALNVILRSLTSKTVPATIRLLEGGHLVEITIPLASSGGEKKSLQQYQPGQHAYISLPGHPASRTFRSNPFSLASIPSVDNNLRFVARILNGNTAKLASTTKSSSATKQAIMIEGPYGLPNHAERLLRYDRILFVAGGVGGTFIAPLYRQLLSDLSPSAGSYRRQKVSFVWVAQSTEDVAWAMPADGKEREGFLERLQLYVTGSRFNGGFEGGVNGDAYAEAEEGIELQERKGLLDSGPDADGQLLRPGAQIRSHAGRPDLRHIVDQTCSHGLSEKVAVVVCGPRSLAARLREEIGEKLQSGRDVWFWDESFAL